MAATSLPEIHSRSRPSILPGGGECWRSPDPAYLVSVGYMDPGNWATDLEGGARFGYRLLWVLVLSNLMADPAADAELPAWASSPDAIWRRPAARTYPRPVSLRACGCSARSPSPPATWPKCWARPSRCNLLFHIPLLVGVSLTAAGHAAGAVVSRDWESASSKRFDPRPDRGDWRHASPSS